MSERLCWWVMGALALTGCSAPHAQPTAPPAHADAPAMGRFNLVPVNTLPDAAEDHDYWYAWRIDTQTGDLEFCTMDSGKLHPTMDLHDVGGLSCTSPAPSVK